MRDGLAVGDLRLADVGLDVELAAHAVDQDVQVELAHAGDDRLAGLLVGADLEGRVLLGEALDRGAQLLLVALGLGLDRDLDHRGRERHRLEDRPGCCRSHSVSPVVVSLRPMTATIWPAPTRRDLLTLVGVHLVDLADPLLAALGAVEHLRCRSPSVPE